MSGHHARILSRAKSKALPSRSPMTLAQSVTLSWLSSNQQLASLRTPLIRSKMGVVARLRNRLALSTRVEDRPSNECEYASMAGANFSSSVRTARQAVGGRELVEGLGALAGETGQAHPEHVVRARSPLEQHRQLARRLLHGQAHDLADGHGLSGHGADLVDAGAGLEAGDADGLEDADEIAELARQRRRVLAHLRHDVGGDAHALGHRGR